MEWAKWAKKSQLKVEQDVFNQFSIGFDYQSQKIDCLKRKGHLQIIDFSNHQGKPPTFDCNDAKKTKYLWKIQREKHKKKKHIHANNFQKILKAKPTKVLPRADLLVYKNNGSLCLLQARDCTPWSFWVQEWMRKRFAAIPWTFALRPLQ